MTKLLLLAALTPTLSRGERELDLIPFSLGRRVRDEGSGIAHLIKSLILRLNLQIIFLVDKGDINTAHIFKNKFDSSISSKISAICLFDQ